VLLSIPAVLELDRHAFGHNIVVDQGLTKAK